MRNRSIDSIAEKQTIENYVHLEVRASFHSSACFNYVDEHCITHE